MTRPLRIGHLTTVASSLRYLLEAQLVGALAQGHEVFGISAPGEDVAHLTELGVTHVALPHSTRSFSLVDDVRTMRDLVRVLRDLRLDVLHTHNPKPGLYGRVLGRMCGVPRVVNTVHGLYATPEDPVVKRAVVYGLEAIASRFSHIELVQNTEDVDLLARSRIASPAKLVHLGNGVDLERFVPGRDAAARAIRAELGVDDDVVLVGTIARLVAEKGYREFFEAAELLADRAVFVAVGPDDPERPDALDRDTVRRAGDAGVRLVGHQADTAPWYRALDIFVLASYREGMPRSAMEAAASGLPVVTTDVRGCRQVVEPRRNGLLVPARSGVALAEAVGELVDDAERRRAMGRAGREVAQERFDESEVVRTVLDSYGPEARSVGAAA